MTATLAVVLAGAQLGRSAEVGDWVADNYVAGASTWSDSSGGSHDATAVDGVGLTVTQNAFGTHAGINFAGGDGATATGFFTVTNDAGYLQGATALTLAAVIRPSATGDNTSGPNFYNNAGLIGNEQPGFVNDWDLGFGGTSAVAGIGNTGGATIADTTLTSPALTLGQAYVLVATWSANGSLNLYVNGTLVATAPTPTGARDANALGAFALGADTAGRNGDTHLFNGQVAELRIYNSVEDAAALSNDLAAAYAVPEPSTWAAVVAGAALTLFALRRRQAA